MRALVTGANGLIGANLVRALLAAGHGVRAFVRPTANLRPLERLQVEIAHGDVRDAQALAQAVRDCDLVFHTAVHFAYGAQADAGLEATALAGTRNVLRAARDARVRRVVVTSSSVVFGFSGRPAALDESAGLAGEAGQPPYVVAKIRQDREATALAAELGIETVLVCPTMSVGPYAETLGPSNAIVLAYLGDPLRMTYPGGCNIVSVRDVAVGHLLAALAGAPGEHYLLGGENLSWPQVHALIAELCGVPAPMMEINHTASYLAAAAEEARAWWRGSRPVTTREQAAMVGRHYWYSHAKAESIGYRPRPARAALAEAVSWLAASRHVSRALRADLRLHPDVYAARRALGAPPPRAGAAP